MKIKKTYNQKQNPKYFILLIMVFVGVYVAIYLFLHQHTWLLIPITLLLFVIVQQVRKNPIFQAINLDEEGIYIHFVNAKYNYAEIAEIKLGSKYKRLE